MAEMRDAFSRCHPVVNFTYFAAVLLFSMFFMHPVFLGISLAASMVYSIWLNGGRAVRFHFLYMLPMLLLVALINPAFNHEGMTILVYVNDNPITQESIVYGVASAVMFISVIIWFSCYNVVMTSDKFIYLFGRLIPALSLILSMVLRFVPKFKAQIRVISNAQKCIGRDVSNGNLWTRARNGIKILSILVTWALENAIETADSMRSRGYGLKGRTSYSRYRFDQRDKLLLGVLGFLILCVLAGACLQENTIQYFPFIKMNAVTAVSVFVYLAYFLLCMLPMGLNIWEEWTWHRLHSKL